MDASDKKKAAEAQLALIDQALNRDGFALRFQNELEEQFEEETGPTRCRMYVRMGLLFLALVNSLLVLDYFCVPDIFALAVYLRLGFAGIMALAFWITLRNPPALIREWLAVGIYVVQAVCIYALVVASSNPLRQNFPLGILLTLLFIVMVLRLRFRYALFAAAALIVVQAMAVFSIHELPVEAKGAPTFLSITFAAFALISLHNLEKSERKGWLHSVRDRLRVEFFEELSTIDPLTGLGNRRSLQQWVEAQHTAANNQSVSLIVVDIDYFKSFNDTFGHLAGDDCIRRVSGILVAEARNTGDRVFRFGGEEFIISLIGIDLPTAISVAERIRREIVVKRIPHKPPTGLNYVTASFGIASSKITPNFDLDTLIGEADSALYEAKKNGRNCVMPPFVALTEDRRATR